MGRTVRVLAQAPIKPSRIPLIGPTHRVSDSVLGWWCGVWVLDLLGRGDAQSGVQALSLTCRATSQMKPASSRAMATQILF